MYAGKISFKVFMPKVKVKEIRVFFTDGVMPKERDKDYDQQALKEVHVKNFSNVFGED